MNSNQNQPLITIGVSAYNRKDYLKQSLDSLLAQTYPSCEIIVVDDGSTDGTEDMMREEYPQIKYVFQENAGDAAAKNHAAQIATGSYIVFNDSDDMFLPDTVERLYQALRGETNTCSYGTYQTIDQYGMPLPTRKKTAVYPSGNITGELLKHIIVNSCGTLMPLKLFLSAGGFDSSLRVAHDYDLFLNLSLKCTFHAIQEPVFLRRRHGSNLSTASYAKQKIVFDVFDNFISQHPELEQKYSSIIKHRTADFHSKLCREALKEKLKEEARFHAHEAFRCKHSLKNFFRLMKSVIKGN